MICALWVEPLYDVVMRGNEVLAAGHPYPKKVIGQ